MLRNALSVPSMYTNLIPPSVMIEAGLVVKDTTKINTTNPMVEDYSIYFTNLDIHITLFLHDVLSYFSVS